MSEIWTPMLAHTWDKVPSKHKRFPLYVQPKLNGMRCIKAKGLFSRTGTPILSVPLLQEGLFKVFPSMEFDGELYAHGMSFEENQAICRRSVNIEEDSRIQYHVFDVHTQDDFATRLKYLQALFCVQGPSRVVLVPTTLVQNENELKELANRYILEGYEGIIIRNPHSGYEHKRSYNLLKHKPFKDTEAVVIDFIPGHGRLSGMLGALRGRLIAPEFESRTVDVGSGFDDFLREYIWKHRVSIEGKVFTLQYQEKTQHGVPRFPTFKHFRDARF